MFPYNLFRVHITNSTFNDNESKFKSNCIYFNGINFSIYDSYFGNNNPCYDYRDLNIDFLRPLMAHNENAGAIYSSSYIFEIKNCNFYNNSNTKGGGFFLNKNSYFNIQYFVIESTIFSNNKAGEAGGSIFLAEDIKKIMGTIVKSEFLECFSNYSIF